MKADLRATGSAEFAQARIGARWGARADEAAWRRIETPRELATMLEAARAGPLAAWLHCIAPEAGVHTIESCLRRRWRDSVHEVAAWVEPAWQPSITWCAHLIDLPALQQWARGETLAAWVGEDEVLRTLDRGAEEPPRGLGVAREWPLLLRAARAAPAQLRALWLGAWQRLLPRASGRAAVEGLLLPLLRAHAEAFAAPQPIDGWAERRLLRGRLVALLRRHAGEPVAAFIFLALQTLEFERLRAEVLARAALPQRTLHG